jgi:long-chain acyl-CoA synthetase
MTYPHFGAFLTAIGRYDGKLALAMKPFLRVEKITYADLCAAAYRTAHFLQAKGLTKGDRIMIVAPNQPRWVELFLGAQLLGVIVVPVDATSNAHTVQTFAAQTKPRMLFRGRAVLSDLEVDIETMVLEELRQATDEQPNKPPHLKLTGEEPSVIVFTSGTTAAPKGVVLTQPTILANVEGVRAAFKLKPSWRFLSILPLSHMYELTIGCLTLLSAGCGIFYVAHITPSAIARGLKEYRITSILAVPQVVTLFLQRIRQTAAAQGQTKKLEHALHVARVLPMWLRRLLFRKVHQQLGGALRFVNTGGAPMPPDVARTWERLGIKVVQGYGLTETAPVLTLNSLKHRQAGSPGRPLPNLEIRIGNDGEIEARGPSVFHEYWHNKTATKDAFTSDGWFKTGDVGVLKHGYLYIQGRAKFAIVLSNGLKVFPEDVEVAAEKQTAWKDICVVGVRRPSGEAVHAVIISDKDDATIDRTMQAVNSQLESFQHITHWVRWPEDTFPRTRLLKVDRKIVQAWANKQRDQSNGAAQTTSSDALTSIIQLVLEQPRARVRDNDRLADLGLDSLRRLAVVSLIEERLGVSVGEAAITQHTTVADLRALIAKGTPDDHDLVRPRWPYMPGWHALGNGVREILFRALLRIWVHQTTVGREHVRGLRGPALFIFNHVDGFDVPVVYNALPYRLRSRTAIAFADDILSKHLFVDAIPRLAYGAFNFARKEPYLPTLEYVGELVDRGWNIAIAPEGKLSPDGTQQPFKSGIGLLAVEMSVPVVPIKTRGLFGVMPLGGNTFPKKRSHVEVRIGKPITFAPHTPYAEATHKLEQIIKDL